MPRLIIDLRHERMECWRIGQRELDVIRSEADWDIVTVDSDSDRVTALAAGADAIWCWHLSAAEAATCPGLRWVSTPAAGADYLDSGDLLAAGLTVTVSHGHHGPAIAEHVLGMVLALARQLHLAPGRSSAGLWWREELDNHMIDLLGATMLIAGYGAIGRAIAERALAFGMRVVGVARSDRPVDDLGVTIIGPDRLDAVLPECRVVVNVLPASPATHHFFDAGRLDRLPEPAVFVNVGRGSTVDEVHLAERARTGRLRLGLDVFEIEPLPADHGLRSLEQALITPHASAVTDDYLLRAAGAQVQQMRRFTAGEALRWTVHPDEAGHGTVL